jgi:hypothetical protein
MKLRTRLHACNQSSLGATSQKIHSPGAGFCCIALTNGLSPADVKQTGCRGLLIGIARRPKKALLQQQYSHSQDSCSLSIAHASPLLRKAPRAPLLTNKRTITAAISTTARRASLRGLHVCYLITTELVFLSAQCTLHSCASFLSITARLFGSFVYDSFAADVDTSDDVDAFTPGAT